MQCHVVDNVDGGHDHARRVFVDADQHRAEPVRVHLNVAVQKDQHAGVGVDRVRADGPRANQALGLPVLHQLDLGVGLEGVKELQQGMMPLKARTCTAQGSREHVPCPAHATCAFAG